MYAGARLLLVFNTHVEPQCIVGVGAAAVRSHLLQENSNVLSLEKDGGSEGKQEETGEKKRWLQVELVSL